MAAQEGAEIRVEENPQQGPPGDPRQNSDGSSPTEVLETMRNLIVELQVFKADNEKLKKAQQEQQEINEVLLRSIVTKKIQKMITMRKRSAKGPPRILVRKQKKETVRLKGHLQLKTKPYQTKKENKQTTLKENLKRLNQLLLMENPGQEKKSRHGCWTSKNTSKSTTIPVT
jgi:hypothetical protein